MADELLIKMPISVGELVDKITILEIKSDQISDPEKNANVRKELALLESCLANNVAQSKEISLLTDELRQVNLALWKIEDLLRMMEKTQDFSPEFIRAARLVYKTNDRRAVLKREINVLSGSAITEEKSYA